MILYDLIDGVWMDMGCICGGRVFTCSLFFGFGEEGEEGGGVFCDLLGILGVLGVWE